MRPVRLVLADDHLVLRQALRALLEARGIEVVAEAEGGDGGGGPSLTPRERQVLQLVGEGRSTKQIAEVLHISVKTAEFHRGRLMKKLNVHDTANLVRYAIREGWIAP